jgi:hypothetical protein
MSYIKLTGLRADLPIGAMAAFGTLRVCQRLPRWKGSKLSWERAGSSFQPVLYGPESLGRDELVTDLMEDVKTAAQREELSWTDQIKGVNPADFVRQSKAAMSRASVDSREGPDWLAGLGNDLASSKKGFIEPTPHDLSGGPQRFPGEAIKLGLSLGDTRAKAGSAIRASYHEALFGPWRYRDNQHSFGWDQSAIKLGAFTTEDPSPMRHSGVRAAVWLAFESLPLFPCFYDGRLVTRAFQGPRSDAMFCWPVWQQPISLSELQTLFGWKKLTADHPDRDELAARNVILVYRAKRFKPNKYLASFRSAEIAIVRAAGAP